MSENSRYWVVIPAAGIGTRMKMETPKQYLMLRGKTILEHTLQRFLEHDAIKGIVVALAPHDVYWDKLNIATHEKIHTTPGGKERYHSVLNGLNVLREFARDNDWVLVHDAVRPCLRGGDIDLLIDSLATHPVGGILAIPVRDTMKRADNTQVVNETVDREGLWHALTPQMFRLALLEEAISAAVNSNEMVTDEAQAIERLGKQPLLVSGHPDNIKITHPSDLPLAELFLTQQEQPE